MCLCQMLALAHLTTQAVGSPVSGTLEVDLIFPRNDTYDPGSYFPVLFAIQNPQLAVPLDLQIDYVIWPSTTNTSAPHNFLRMGGTNIKDANPYFVWDRAPKWHEMEDDWLIVWTATVTNCSTADGNVANVTHRVTPGYGNVARFTTKKGAKQPDFVAATSENTCADTRAFTYNVTGVVDMPNMPPFGSGQKNCTLLSWPRPDPNPCAVKIDTAKAANITKNLENIKCGPPWSVGHCPPYTEEDSSRGTRQFGDMSLALAMATGMCVMGALSLT